MSHPTGKTVTAGSWCSREGEQAVTVTGVPVTCCTRPKDTRLRWRSDDDSEPTGGARSASLSPGSPIAVLPGQLTLPFMPVINLDGQDPGSGSDDTDLTEQEKQVLAFEGEQIKPAAGTKAQAIRERLGLAETRYYQLLNSAINKAAALTVDAQLVRRLLRLRAKRMAWR